MITLEGAILLGVLGATMGSFAGAMAWRIHAKKKLVNDRSECESCHHKLGVFDLIPIVSWFALKGKCRYCGAPIGTTPLLTEVAIAALFVVSYLYWPLGLEVWQTQVLFGLWLVYVVALAVLLIYDMRWMLLPDRIVLPLVVLSLFDAALRASLMPDASITTYATHVVLGAAALAGVYGGLYLVSGGKWVGFGDVKLGVFMGVVLGWQGAFLVLGLANVIGFCVVLPGLLFGKLTRASRVPFGPFLIAAFVVAGLFGDRLIHWYMRLIGL